MKIGFIGVGKLGMPVAVAIDAKGHDVMVYDADHQAREILEKREFPHKEAVIQDWLKYHKIKWSQSGYEGIVDHSNLIFLAVQTPHDPQYEGVTRIPEERADFDYSYLIASVKAVAETALLAKKHIELVVISTVLPGTYKRDIEPLLNEYVDFTYNPFFIAMGQVIPDFLNPEFVLVGGTDKINTGILEDFYATIHNKKLIRMPIQDAELTKVAYNTFIGMKIAFANTMMEICHINGGNVDNVMNALKMAKDRLISPKYLTAGMGDGGGCHPRDNIAMSYLAKKLQLSHNIFDDIMKAREDQTEFIADLAHRHMLIKKMPVVILGRAFKPETDLETGSPAILLQNLLAERGIRAETIRRYNVWRDIGGEPCVYVIATQHKEFEKLKLPEGSVVIDPFGYYKGEGVEVIRIGRH